MTKNPSKKDKTPNKKDKTPSKKPEKEEAQFKNRDTLLVVGIVVIIAIFAVLLYSLSRADEPVQAEVVEYNGFTFTKVGNSWTTNIKIGDQLKGWERDYTFYFHHTPQEVEDVPSLRNSRNDTIAPNLFLNANKIYITMDPEYPAEVVLSGVEISKVIGKVYEKEVTGALTRSYEGSDAPVVTCDDIGPGVRVIKLDLGNETRIYSDNGCIVVEGENPQEMLRAATRLTFEMLKIL